MSDNNGERWEWLCKLDCNHFILDKNAGPAANYVTAKEWIEEYTPEWFKGAPSDVLERMKDANTIWELQIYPSTPIGFNVYFGATMEEAVDAAMAREKDNG